MGKFSNMLTGSHTPDTPDFGVLPCASFVRNDPFAVDLNMRFEMLEKKVQRVERYVEQIESAVRNSQGDPDQKIGKRGADPHQIVAVGQDEAEPLRREAWQEHAACTA